MISFKIFNALGVHPKTLDSLDHKQQIKRISSSKSTDILDILLYFFMSKLVFKLIQ